MKVSPATKSPFDRSLWGQVVVRHQIIAAFGSVPGLFPLCPDGARALLHWPRPVPSMHSAIPVLADSSLDIRGLGQLLRIRHAPDCLRALFWLFDLAETIP
jgi:hypothetical protein